MSDEVEAVVRKADEMLTALLKAEIDHVVRDMAQHVGDEIFELLKRHGLMMRTEASSTAMQVLAAVQVLRQAVDQCSRAAEEDCTGAVVALFRDCLPKPLRARLQDNPHAD